MNHTTNCSSDWLLVRIVVVAVLLWGSIYVTDASSEGSPSQRLRVHSEDSDVSFDQSRVLPATLPPPPPPSNDECDNAIIIPSTFPMRGLTYTTPGVSMAGATHSVGYQAAILCLSSEDRNDVWYKFTPKITSFYEFSVNINSTQIEVYTNNDNRNDTGNRTTTCQNADRIRRCGRSVRSKHMELLQANQTYLLLVQSPPVTMTTNVTQATTPLIQVTVHTRLPPSNNVCSNAKRIELNNQTKPINVTANISYGFFSESYSYCSNARFPGIWYQLTNPYVTPLSIRTTIENFGYNDYAGSPIGIDYFDSSPTMIVFQGNRCGVLECQERGEAPTPFGNVASFRHDKTYGFVAEGLSSYFISFHADPMKRPTFTATIDVQKRFFSINDSQTDTAVQPLSSAIDYFDLPSTTSNLNLQANFDLSNPKAVKSVRMTLDNPKRSYCEQKAPYSVFGDNDGDYRGMNILLGPNKVTATPFAQSNCTGTKGTTLEKRFTVTGCDVQFDLVTNAAGEFVFMNPFISNKVSRITGKTKESFPESFQLSLPCKVNIVSGYQCGFPIMTLRMELRNGTTNELLHENSLSSDADSFNTRINNLRLFDETKRHIAPGFYTLLAIVNNITHPAVNFTVVKTQKCA